jgi:hypothetical protein
LKREMSAAVAVERGAQVAGKTAYKGVSAVFKCVGSGCNFLGSW